MNAQEPLPVEQAEAASQLLKALASPHRLMIACRLCLGEETVGALAAWLGVRESVVSQHLAVMRRERLVTTRREGQSIYYALQSEVAREVVGALSRALRPIKPAQKRRR
jgi:DNA-binding transcriptional ArsR family regulator